MSALSNDVAERALLGSVLMSPETALPALEGLLGDDFADRRNRFAFEALRRLAFAGRPIDNMTLAAELRAAGELEASGGIAYLAELGSEIPTAANAEWYAQQVRNKATLRSLSKAGVEIQKAARDAGDDADTALAAAEQLVAEAGKRRVGDAFESASTIIRRVAKQVEDAFQRRGEVIGQPIGLVDVDRFLLGLEPQQLVIIGARPAMGKTSFMLQALLQTALHRSEGAACFSLEMSKEQLLRRAIASEGRIDATRLRLAQLHDNEWASYARIVSSIDEAPLWIDDTGGASIVEIQARARRVAAKARAAGKPLKLVALDYLQLVGGDGKGDNREQEVAAVSRGLKALAKELNVPIIALSQLNRGLEARKDKRPILADLRESGQVEQDADVVLFLYRDEVYNPDDTGNKGVAEVIVAKQRDGRIGKVNVKWTEQWTRFDNLAA